MPNGHEKTQSIHKLFLVHSYILVWKSATMLYNSYAIV